MLNSLLFRFNQLEKILFKNTWESGIAVFEDNVQETFSSNTYVDDRRTSARPLYSSPALYRCVNESKWHPSKTVDISDSGLRLLTKKNLPAGAEMRLQLRLPNSKKMVKLCGEVVWNKPKQIANQLFYEIGVRFPDLKKVSSRGMMFNFIADRLAEQSLQKTSPYNARPAETLAEIESACKLLYREYLKRGYCAEHPSGMHYNHFMLMPDSRIFVLARAIEDNQEQTAVGRPAAPKPQRGESPEQRNNCQVGGTISLFSDSPCGLPLEDTFGKEIQKIRQPGVRLAEVGLLSIDGDLFGRKKFSLVNLQKQKALFELFGTMVYHAQKIGVTDIVIAVHPKHRELYGNPFRWDDATVRDFLLQRKNLWEDLSLESQKYIQAEYPEIFTQLKSQLSEPEKIHDDKTPPETSSKGKVLLLLSGGKDSPEALKRLIQDGYDVHGLCIDGIQGKEKIGAIKAAQEFGIQLDIVQISWFNEDTWNPYLLVLRDIAMVAATARTAKKIGARLVAAGVKRADLQKPDHWWLQPFMSITGLIARLSGFQVLYPIWDIDSPVHSETQTRVDKNLHQHISKIPDKINALLVVTQVLLFIYVYFLAPMFLNHQVSIGWAWSVWGIALLMSNHLWALFHESVHLHLFSDKKKNLWGGRILGYCHGTPYWVAREFHLAHHRFNRTTQDSYDIYNPRKTPKWKAAVKYYYVLLGGLYLEEFIMPGLSLLPKKWIKTVLALFPAHSFLSITAQRLTSNHQLFRQLRQDTFAMYGLLALSFLMYGKFAWVLAGFYAIRMFMISFLDYVYHYQTHTNVLSSMNLSLPRGVSAFLLHFNYHEIHHLHPSLNWTELPLTFKEEKKTFEGGYFQRALVQLKGPMTADELAASLSSQEIRIKSGLKNIRRKSLNLQLQQ